MRKRTQNIAAIEDPPPANTTPSPCGSAKPAPVPSTPGPKHESSGSEAAPAFGSRESGTTPSPDDKRTAFQEAQPRIEKLLAEGATFEDVFEAVNQNGESDVSLNDIRVHFQGNPNLQAKRMRYLVENAEFLLTGLGDPKSAEERLAKAAYLEAYLKLHRDAAPVELKDAEHARMERANLDLKHKLVIVQRDKARQALSYSKQKTRILVLTQEKIKEEILKLQQEASRQKSGEPMGPAVLERIQQLYGLACQRQSSGGLGNVPSA